MQAAANRHDALIDVNHSLYHIAEPFTSHFQEKLARDGFIDETYFHLLSRTGDAQHTCPSTAAPATH
jgi:phage anti-repressor protein